jgi:hypothetical protein
VVGDPIEPGAEFVDFAPHQTGCAVGRRDGVQRRVEVRLEVVERSPRPVEFSLNVILSNP